MGPVLVRPGAKNRSEGNAARPARTAIRSSRIIAADGYRSAGSKAVARQMIGIKAAAPGNSGTGSGSLSMKSSRASGGAVPDLSLRGARPRSNAYKVAPSE
jgi:hypothetical protein